MTVESEDLKSAFYTAMQKAHGKKFSSEPVGRFFELESLTTGKQNELPKKPKYLQKRKQLL